MRRLLVRRCGRTDGRCSVSRYRPEAAAGYSPQACAFPTKGERGGAFAKGCAAASLRISCKTSPPCLPGMSFPARILRSPYLSSRQPLSRPGSCVARYGGFPALCPIQFPAGVFTRNSRLVNPRTPRRMQKRLEPRMTRIHVRVAGASWRLSDHSARCNPSQRSARTRK